MPRARFISHRHFRVTRLFGEHSSEQRAIRTSDYVSPTEPIPFLCRLPALLASRSCKRSARGSSSAHGRLVGWSAVRMTARVKGTHNASESRLLGELLSHMALISSPTLEHYQDFFRFESAHNSPCTSGSADGQPDAQPTNRRFNHHKTAATVSVHCIVWG